MMSPELSGSTALPHGESLFNGRAFEFCQSGIAELQLRRLLWCNEAELELRDPRKKNIVRTPHECHDEYSGKI